MTNHDPSAGHPDPASLYQQRHRAAREAVAVIAFRFKMDRHLGDTPDLDGALADLDHALRCIGLGEYARQVQRDMFLSVVRYPDEYGPYIAAVLDDATDGA